LLGLRFPNPVGLAAGFDKDAETVKSFVFMGLGFAEVGTVTPLAQAGNPKPRLFRHPTQEALQNAMGFNNAGMESMRKRLKDRRRSSIPIGINIGKNKATPDERSEQDYLALVEGLSDCCDYFVVNVSSPNTPGLRDLQDTQRLRRLVEQLCRATGRPLMVKLSPDLAAGQPSRLAQSALEGGARGIVLTNTTVDYSLVPGCETFGGLSGRLLTERSYEVLREVAPEVGRDAVLVSVGGIDSGAEAYRRLRAGARLVEVYTGLIYQGPGLARRMNRELSELLERDGISKVEDVIGVDL
jgi:dihydroorotate dehydrogenase